MADDNADCDARPGARPWRELRATGLLWLINRAVFHPRGFALGLVERDGEIEGWALLGDGREVWAFSGPEDDLFAAAQATLTPLGPDAESGQACSALCRDVERDRDQLAKLVAEIGDVMSPTGERPDAALGALVDDVAQLIEQRDQHAADAQAIADANDRLRTDLAAAVGQRDQLVTLVGEILREFHQRGHPGRQCLSTGWVWVETINGWRARLAELSPPPDPPAT